jgi:hypothetical protein
MFKSYFTSKIPKKSIGAHKVRFFENIQIVKGQLISKYLFGVINFLQKTNKINLT